MFKQIFAFLMVLSITFNQANAGSDEGLKAAFDELNFSLSVEWDQKDKEFYSQQMKVFSARLMELQNKGLTRNELVTFVKSEVKNQAVAKDLETAFNIVSINKMNSEDATKYMVETMKKSYSSGSAWNGEVVVYLAIGVLIIAATLALAARAASSNSCANTVSECDYNGELNCYYDMWGERWCELGYDCTEYCN